MASTDISNKRKADDDPPRPHPAGKLGRVHGSEDVIEGLSGFCSGCHRSGLVHYLCPCEGDRRILMGQTEKCEFAIVRLRMSDIFADGKIFSKVAK